MANKPFLFFMNNQIFKYQKQIAQQKTNNFKRFYLVITLFLLYFLSSVKCLFLILFTSPEKSFVLLNNQDARGVWQRSYYQHRKFRHNLRFGSVSFTLLLVAATISINFILSFIAPIQQVTIAEAEESISDNAIQADAKPLAETIITVNTDNNTIDAAGGICNNATIASLPGPDGKVSLFEAICAANLTPVGDTKTINFHNSIANININIALPTITTQNLTIDGGSDVNINGQGVDNSFLLNGNSNTVMSLTIGNFNIAGIKLLAADNCTIHNNTILKNGDGIIISGTAQDNNIIGNTIGGENSLNGILLETGADNTTISNNVIVGNSESGIRVETNNSTIDGNYIGVDKASTILENGVDGITIWGDVTSGNIANNIIGGNYNRGIFCAGSGLTINNNQIGIYDGIDIGNIDDGIFVSGSLNAFSENIIANNHKVGLRISGGTQNIVTKNIIYNNTISNRDNMNGGNLELTPPVIDFAVASNNKLVYGISTPDVFKFYELFAANEPDASELFIGTFTVADSLTLGEISGDFSSYKYLTAAGSDENNNYSVFSTREIVFDNNAPITYADPIGGTYTDSVTVTLTVDDETDPEHIDTYYTLDGTEPVIGLSTLYSGPFAITENATLKFFSYDQFNQEQTNIEVYKIIASEPTEDEDNPLTNRELWELDGVELKGNNLPSSTLKKPTFLVKNLSEYIGSAVKIIIKERGQSVYTDTKNINEKGRAKFLVEENLDFGLYTLNAGFADTGTTGQVTEFQIINVQPDLKQVPEILVPPQVINVLTSGKKVIASLLDENNNEIVNVKNDHGLAGVFPISFPFLPDLGLYTLKVIVETNGVKSKAAEKDVILTPNKYVSVLNTVSTDPSFWYRLVKVSQPTVVGNSLLREKVFINDQEVKKYNCSDICDWQYQLPGANTGVNNLVITYKDQDNNVIKTANYKFLRHLSAIIPRIVSHPNNYESMRPLMVTIIGGIDNKVVISKMNGETVKECTLVGGTCKVSLASVSEYGENSFKLRALENGYKWSGYSYFNYTLRRPFNGAPAPAPVIEQPIAEPVTEPIAEPTSETDTNNQIIDSQKEEETINNIEDLIINEYNKTSKSEPPDNLPNLTVAKAELSETQKQEVKEKLNQALQRNDQVQLINNGQLITAVTLADGTLQFNVTREYNFSELIKEIFSSQRISLLNGELRLTGQIPNSQLSNLPAYATVSVYSQPIVKVAKADETGRWVITVPLELLPPGQHIAYAQTEVNGVQSDQVELVKFAIQEKTKLSNTAWLVIANLAIALILLIVIIIRQIILNKKIISGQNRSQNE